MIGCGETDQQQYTPGLYETGSIALYEAEGAKAIAGKMIKSWDELVAEGTVCVDNGVVYTPFDSNEFVNPSADALAGDLMLPEDESVTILGDAYTNEYGEFVGRFAFTYCTNLTNITIPNCVTSICEGAFAGCVSLTNVNIPDSVIAIKAGAFANCESFTNIYIPNGVTAIEPQTFGTCIMLTNVTIPVSVTSIGAQAFWVCKRLVNIIFDGTIAQWNAITKGEEWNAEVPATEVVCSDGEVSLV